MDSYLESPGTWLEVHKQLIVEIADSLNPLLLPKYYAAIDERTYMDMPEENTLIGIPDVSITAVDIRYRFFCCMKSLWFDCSHR